MDQPQIIGLDCTKNISGMLEQNMNVLSII